MYYFIVTLFYAQNLPIILKTLQHLRWRCRSIFYSIWKFLNVLFCNSSDHYEFNYNSFFFSCVSEPFSSPESNPSLLGPTRPGNARPTPSDGCWFPATISLKSFLPSCLDFYQQICPSILYYQLQFLHYCGSVINNLHNFIRNCK